MRIWKVLSALVLIAAAAALLLWPLAKHAAHDSGKKSAGGSAASMESAPHSPEQPKETNQPLSHEQQAMLEDPRVIEFAQRLDFQKEVRDFFSQAADLPQQDVRNRADAITNQLGNYEATGEISASEALLVRLAIVKLVETDEPSAKRAAATLIEEYKRASDTRLASWEDRVEPEFQSYKEREKAIVAEVMSMKRFPDGLTRDQYLRQRLQQARIETMGQGKNN